MATPKFEDQQDQIPDRQPISLRTKLTIAAIAVAVIVMIVLHVAHVFGP